MTRETASKHQISEFTPLFDILIKECDLMTAAVYGCVWRFCKRRDCVCYATISTIAETVGVSYRTALRRLKALCDIGYLIDHDPGLRNAPHRYSITGKVDLEHVAETRAVVAPSSASQADEPPSSASQAVTSSASQAVTSSASQADEETKETKETSGVGVHTNKQQQHTILFLTDFGISLPVARRLTTERSPDDIEAWVGYAKDASGLINPPAFVVARLQAGEPPPENGRHSEVEDGRRYLEWKGEN